MPVELVAELPRPQMKNGVPWSVATNTSTEIVIDDSPAIRLFGSFT